MIPTGRLYSWRRAETVTQMLWTQMLWTQSTVAVFPQQGSSRKFRKRTGVGGNARHECWTAYRDHTAMRLGMHMTSTI